MTDTNIDLLYLSEPDTIAAGVTDMAACIDVMAETLRLHAAGDFRMGGPSGTAQGINVTFPAFSPFPAMPLDGPDRRFAAMPAYLGGDIRLAGVKWYGSNAANRDRGLPRSIHTIVLNDPDTGRPLAIMAGNLVSAYRTAAVPGVGARYLARPDAESIAIIGPGAMNRTSLEAFMTARPSIRQLRIVGRRRASSDGYADFARTRFPELESVDVVDSIETAVHNADIISVAATSPSGSMNYPYLNESWLKPGAFLSLPANVRFDEDFLVARARKVVDSRTTFESWAEELPTPSHESLGFVGMQFTDLVRAGRLHRNDIVDVGEIVAGNTSVRDDPDQVTLFGFGGLPIEDVAWAAHVYRTAQRAGVGTTLNFWTSPTLR